MALRWFRFGKQQEEDAAQESAAPEEEAPPEALQVEQEATEPTDEQSSSTGPKKRRRRGSRGGKGRKKPVSATAAQEADSDDAQESSVPVAAKAPTTRSRQASKPDAKPDRKQSRSGNRRRTPTKRAPLPAAKRELVISVDVGEQRVAILEDDRVAEVYLERPERRSIAGNIYLGVVDNVLPGMEAAFVEIGLEKNGFLYVDEIVGPELEGRKGARKIQDLIKRGQTVMVQAVKDPMKSKGARLTTEISLPGRFLVYVPNGEGSGVSRRLEDAERTRLKDIVKRLDPKGGGIIVRTAAEGASAEDIERDLVFLQRLWKTIETKAKGASAPELVYEEAELPLRIVRDLFAGDFVGAQIDDDRTYRRIVSYLKKTSPHMVERLDRYRGKDPLFEASGVDAEIRSTLDRRVDLPSGGYLVFDYAEAFTVVDVNTGRFVGSRGKSAQGRLEDTIVKNNLEAVKEVVRQLRLRDIGGIIVIDFIDMANPKNRETVEEALRSELERDRTKTYVVEISPLGLVEMTRQNVTDGPREILTSRCPVCEGAGVVVSDATHALEIERKLRAIAKGSRVQAFKVAVHPRVLALLVGPGGRRLTALDAASRRRFFLVPAAANGHVHLDHFEVIAQGKLETTRPSAPVEEGSSVELKLVEVGLHDPTAAVGKVDGGYEVVVAGAAKLVGKKVTATVGSVLEGAAYATLADDVVADATPITFEAEAEKPMRASRSKKEPLSAEAAVEIATSDADVEDERRGRQRVDGGLRDALEAKRRSAPTGRRRRSGRVVERGEAATARSRPLPRRLPTASSRAQRATRTAAPPRESTCHRPIWRLPARMHLRPRRRRSQPRRRSRPRTRSRPTSRSRPGARKRTGPPPLRTPTVCRSASARAGALAAVRSAASRPWAAAWMPFPRTEMSRSRSRSRPSRTARLRAYVPMSEWIDDFDSRSRT